MWHKGNHIEHVDAQKKIWDWVECISNTGYRNNLDINQHSQKKKDINQNIQNHTTSFHFFIVSRLPRLSSAFCALAEKLSVDKVLDKFEALGLTCTINKIFELLPAPMKVCQNIGTNRRQGLHYAFASNGGAEALHSQKKTLFSTTKVHFIWGKKLRQIVNYGT